MIPDAKGCAERGKRVCFHKNKRTFFDFSTAALIKETKGDRVKTNDTFTLQDKTLLRKEAKR